MHRPQQPQANIEISKVMYDVLTKEYVDALAKVSCLIVGHARVDVMTLVAIRNILNDNRELRAEIEKLKRSVNGEKEDQKENADETRKDAHVETKSEASDQNVNEGPTA